MIGGWWSRWRGACGGPGFVGGGKLVLGKWSCWTGGQVGLLELVEANWWWAGGVGRVGGGQQAGPSSSTAHGGTTASGTTTFPEPIFGIFDIFDIFGTLLPSFRRHPYYDQDN